MSDAPGRTAPGGPPRALLLVYPLFFLSGLAGLVYQVVWSRQFHEVFGVTVYAVTTVLATFLAGLALGAVILGRIADRGSSSLQLYGWLEIGIALTALVGSWSIEVLAPAHVWAANRLAPDSAALLGLRALLASMVILPPTVLMGGTLPVVTRVFVRQLRGLGREVSLLYALNTFGAVAGTLLAGFLLVRLLGLNATLWTAVAVNLLVGAAALWLARTVPDRPARRDEALPPAAEGESRGGAGLLVVMGLSGFVTLGLEVFWTRVLVMIIGTTTYAFVTMLSSFLLGIALGSFVAGRIVDRVGSMRRAFGWIQLGIVASTLATLPVINTSTAQHWLTGWGTAWLTLVALRFGVSLLITLLPALLIGMTFPLAATIWTRDLRRLGGRLGQVYGANTLGNILGAAVTGFVVLPALGLQKGVVVLTTLNLVNAAWGFSTAEASSRRSAARLRAALVVAGVVSCLPLLLAWKPRPLRVWDEQESDQSLYYREGVVSTVKVLQKGSDPDQLWMTVDGIRIGQSYGGVDAKQQALAHFPFLLRAGQPPRRLLSIGLGTGILVGESARHPGVESVDCLEISPSVVEAAALFDRFNGGALDDPRIRVINDDGVNFLRRTPLRYDAIVSDAKSRTKHAANATFFSADYYRLCRSHLSPGGLMIQWLPLDIPPSEMRIVLRTFQRVFPNVYVLVAAPYSCFLVGMEEPLVLDVDRMGQVLAEPHTEHLRRYGVQHPYDFVGLLAADRSSLRGWLDGDDTVNTLEHPVLEFYSPRAHAVAPSRRIDENLIGLLPENPRPAADATLLDVDEAVVEAWSRAAARLAAGLDLLDGGEANALAGFLDLAEEAVAAARGSLLLRHTAVAAYRRALELEPDEPRTHSDLGRLLDGLGRPGTAADHYRRVVEMRPDDIRTRVRLGLALKRAGRVDEALESLDAVVRLKPDAPVALTAAAEILATHPDPDRRDAGEAMAFAEKAARLTGHRNPHVLNTLATAYAAGGEYSRAVATAEEALALATSSRMPPLAAEIRERLSMFREGRPYRGSPEPRVSGSSAAAVP